MVDVGASVTVMVGVISPVGSIVTSGVGVGVVSGGAALNFKPKKKAKPSKPTTISKIRKDKSDCRPLAGINGVSSSAIKAYYKPVFYFVKLGPALAFLACKFPVFTL